jgi:hypothetical protein
MSEDVSALMRILNKTDNLQTAIRLQLSLIIKSCFKTGEDAYSTDESHQFPTGDTAHCRRAAAVHLVNWG